jgi:hypothetical protein
MGGRTGQAPPPCHRVAPQKRPTLPGHGLARGTARAWRFDRWPRVDRRAWGLDRWPRVDWRAWGLDRWPRVDWRAEGRIAGRDQENIQEIDAHSDGLQKARSHRCPSDRNGIRQCGRQSGSSYVPICATWELVLLCPSHGCVSSISGRATTPGSMQARRLVQERQKARRPHE